MVFAFLEKRLQYNWKTLRQSPLTEISGAFGDLGTLLPLMTALAAQGAISFSSTLVFTGCFNIVTGAFFGIPLPVQPMKAIAAAVISQGGASIETTTAAGGLVSLAVLTLAVTGLLRWLSVTVPVPVAKGIQLGAGLSLAISMTRLWGSGLPFFAPQYFDNSLYALLAFLWLISTQSSGGGPGVPVSFAESGHRRSPGGFAGRLRHLWGRACYFFPLFFPYALTMTIIGLALALAQIFVRHKNNSAILLPHFALWRPQLFLPNWLASDAMSMAVGQLPLTTLNSVIAVSSLANDLFGSRRPWDKEGKDAGGVASAEDDVEAGRMGASTNAPGLNRLSSLLSFSSVTAFGLSVGVMNLVGCWFGAMPVCHGAGGLAAQYRFGARSGASVMILGLFKVLLGLFAGETLVDLLEFFPKSILGILVLAAGLELAKAGLSLNHGAPDLWIEEATGGYGQRDSAGPSAQQEAVGTVGQQPYGHNSVVGSQARPIGRRQRVLSDEERAERWTVMLMTTACILAFKNDAIGFVAGLLCHGGFRESRKSRIAANNTGNSHGNSVSNDTNGGDGSDEPQALSERTSLLAVVR